ncbi:MAG: hypothetical protein IIZ83_02870 [Oscillospiraceae bacterium]|nr:hypothetical protein [Oscillospiraceae bacterium]
MANNIGPKIGVQGEGEFRKEISQINTTLKTMGTEMDKVTSSFIGNEKSVEALTAKNEVLQQKFDELSRKAELQKSRLAELDAAGVDPTSASYQKLVQDLNKTETEMNKTEAEIKDNQSAMDGLGKETDDVAASLDKGAESSKRMGDNLKANLLSDAIVGGIKALGDGIKKAASALMDAAAAADDMQTLALKTGITTEELQKLQYAAGTVDVSVETVAGAMGKLTKTMSSAASGSGAAADAFEKLGVAVKNDDGTFRDRNEVFNEAIAALGGIADETERDATAMAIFGKSATELNPLILGGAEALQQLGDHAEQAGLILSGDALSALSNLNDRFDVLKQTLGLAAQNFLVQFAEPLTKAIDKVIGYVERLVQAFQSGGFKGLANEAGTVATEIAQKFTEILPDIAEFATELITTLTEGFVEMLPMIVQSAVTIITTFAQGLAESLPELIPCAVDAILTIVDTLTSPDNIGSMVDAAIAIIIALANGLINALPQLIAKAPEIIANLVTALVENVPKLLSAAFEIVKTIVTGIVDNLSQIGEAAVQIVNTIGDGIVNLWNSIVAVGTQIVQGIWAGIQGAAQWFWSQITGFFKGIVDGVKESLGIASPSKVFAQIGGYMAEGLGVGWDKEMQKVEDDMMSSLPTGFDVGINGSVGGAEGALGMGMVEEITIPVTVGDVELARVLYRHIVGEGQRIGTAMVV